MYCDDVDYSWRVREAGRTVVFQPAAVVFHDKHLTIDGRWMPTSAEVTSTPPQAALLLAHKWSETDAGRSGSSTQLREVRHRPQQAAAAAEFRRRQDAGELVEPRDPDHLIGTFVGYRYAEHRYAL